MITVATTGAYEIAARCLEGSSSVEDCFPASKFPKVNQLEVRRRWRHGLILTPRDEVAERYVTLWCAGEAAATRPLLSHMHIPEHFRRRCGRAFIHCTFGVFEDFYMRLLLV
jgi:hypothetical protein